MNKKQLYYLTPGLLGILVFSSNFLSTDLFQIGFQNFAVWFSLSLLVFACGWFINHTFGYIYGGKVVFAVVVATTIISLVMVFIFNKYFGFTDLLTENLILFSLRNIMLGAMGFFGMAVPEVIRLQKENETLRTKGENYESLLERSKKEAELTIQEAKIKAEKIIFEAEKKSNDILLKKEQIETNLKQFIQIERELINKYQED